MLRETGVEPHLLEVELTETTLMEATPATEEGIRALSELGVRISLDDFGRGYASLEYLRRFPLDKLKIDSSFLRDVDDNQRDATILRSIVALAAQLGLDVIAEGVEPASSVDLLIEQGCSEAQGFYFAEPLPAASVITLLRKGSERIEPPEAS